MSVPYHCGMDNEVGGFVAWVVRRARSAWTLVPLPALLVTTIAVAFLAGRWSVTAFAITTPGPSASLVAMAPRPAPGGAAASVSALRVQAEGPADPRELIPLPGPGQGPGQGTLPAPGDQPAPGECLLVLPDGQLLRIPVPGQGDGPGPGGGTPELFPLTPAPPRTVPAPSRPQAPPPGTLQM